MTPAAHAEVPELLHGPFAFQEVQKKKPQNHEYNSNFFFFFLAVTKSIDFPAAASGLF